MRSACKTLGIIYLILGVIGSFAIASSNGVTVSYNTYSGITEERSLLLTVAWFVSGILITAIGTVILYALGEILENQESLMWRMSEIEGKLYAMEKKEKKPNAIANGDSWKCPKCGRVNANHTGTCACGQKREK